MLIGTSILRKVVLKAHCKLRQLSEMVQSPEVAKDKVCVLRLLSEAHIWDSVTLGGQEGGSSGGDGEGDEDGEGDGEAEGEGEGDGEEEGGGDSEGESDGDGEGDGDGRAVEVGSVVVTSGQMSAQCM